MSRVFSAATFYKAFSLAPRGKRIVKVCTGTACHIRGAPLLVCEFTRLLGIKPGQTTQDLGFTLETVNCLGACAMAPLVAVNEDYHGELRIDQVKDLVRGRDPGVEGGQEVAP
jgi:NADH:ubiquinone oxidoreductase subunit E